MSVSKREFYLSDLFESEYGSYLSCFIYMYGGEKVRQNGMLLMSIALALHKLEYVSEYGEMLRPESASSYIRVRYNPNIYYQCFLGSDCTEWSDIPEAINDNKQTITEIELSDGLHHKWILWKDGKVFFNPTNCDINKYHPVSYYSYSETKEKEEKGAADRFSLIPPRLLTQVADIFMFGANKYGKDNWKEVPIQKFEASFERHWSAYKVGVDRDNESDLYHICHAIANLFIIGAKEYED